MTWSYNDADLSTDLNKVRRLINDVNSSSPLFTDEEVGFFVDSDSNVFGAASIASRALASKFAAGVNKTVGKLKIDLSDKFKHYDTLANQLADMAADKGAPQIFAGAMTKTQKQTQVDDTNRVEPAFFRDMFDFQGEASSTSE